jgi:hypothetical protein
VIVALVALAAVAAAALWLVARSEPYEATADILVTPARDDGGADRSLPLLRSSGDRTRIVQTAASLIDSAGAAKASRAAPAAAGRPIAWRGAVTVEPVGQTDVVAVTAQADSPALPAGITNEFARAALDARAEALQPDRHGAVAPARARRGLVVGVGAAMLADLPGPHRRRGQRDDAAACIAGFGRALAQAGRDVLLVDLDPAGGVAARVAGAEPNQGSLRVHGRRALPAQKERERHDWLLVHAPSTIESGEAARVAGSADAVVVVVRPRRTTVDDLELALRLLEWQGVRPDGVILVTGRRLRERLERLSQTWAGAGARRRRSV